MSEQEKVYSLEVTTSEFKTLTRLAINAAINLPVPMLQGKVQRDDTVYHLKVSASYYKELMTLVCNAQLDGSLLASLLEQKEMQDAPDQ